MIKNTEEKIKDMESLWEVLIRIPNVEKINWTEAIVEETVAENFQKSMKDIKPQIKNYYKLQAGLTREKPNLGTSE